MTNIFYSVFSIYKNTSFPTKLFLIIRFMTAPFIDIEKYVPKKGIILDLGCGHGLFSVILYVKSENRKILGVDPDRGKIKIARKLANSLPQLEFSTKTLKSLVKQKKIFNSIIISDVVYLLSDEGFNNLLSDCKKILSKKGRLFIKTSQKNDSLGHKLAVAQEQVMVKLLKKTQSYEETLHFRTIDEYHQLFAKNKLVIKKEVPLHTLFFHPHYLFILESE